MAPPRLAVTLEQDGIIGHHEQDVRLNVLSPEFLDQAWQGREIRVPIAGIDADGYAAADFAGAGRHFLDNRLEQARRQIVDAVIAQVFQHVKRNGLSGTGQAAYDD